MHFRFFIVITIILIGVSACYWGKHLEEKTNILIVDNFSLKQENSTSHAYINNHTSEDYKNKLVEGLKNELQYYNVTVVDKKYNSIDYTIIIDFVEFKETKHSEVVNDESSPHHGKTYELIDCDSEAKFSLYKGNKVKLIDTYTIYADKEEKISNNRNLGDYVFGTNKDNAEYREKLLPDDVFLRLAEKCGKRISGKATKKISKSRK